MQSPAPGLGQTQVQIQAEWRMVQELPCEEELAHVHEEEAPHHPAV